MLSIFPQGQSSLATTVDLNFFPPTAGSGFDTGNSGTPPTFTFTAPVVTSVTDADNGDQTSGTIMGGDTLDINGTGLDFPNGGSANAIFSVNGSQVKTVALSASDFISSTDVEITSPILLSILPQGQSSLATTVDLNFFPPTAGSGFDTGNSGTPPTFTFTAPVVTSVTDADNGDQTSGTIMGGDTLDINGTGLDFPNGGSANAIFSVNGSQVKTVALSASDFISSTDVEITSPILLSILPQGQSSLATTVDLNFFPPTAGSGFDTGNSGTPPTFTFTGPIIDSVTDQTTGTSTGPITGGDTLAINGSGFIMPSPGSAEVQFYDNSDNIVKTVVLSGADILSTNEIDVTEPDFSSLAGQIPSGQSTLDLEVVVDLIGTGGHDAPSTPASAGDDNYSAVILKITSADTATFTEGQGGSFTVTTAGGESGSLTESGALPPGVSFTDNRDGTATLAGTPDAGSADLYPLTITASNGVDPDVTQNFTLVVDGPPSITSGETAAFTIGQSGTFSVTINPGYNGAAADPTAVTITESGALPSGVTFTDNGDGTATLGGKPDAGTGGTYTLTITASNGISPDDTETLTLSVDGPPSITSAATTSFTAGASGTFSVTTNPGYNSTSDDPTGVTLSVSGTLPSGVTFTDNGDGTATLAGTPDDGSAGSYPLTITASNGIAPDGTQSFTLSVDGPPALTSADTTSFTVGQSGTFSVTTNPGYDSSAADPTAVTITESGALPSGVTFADNGDGTATLGGTPDTGAGGTYTLTITASNSISPDATQSFTLSVDEPPSITSADTATETVGQSGTFAITTAPGYNSTSADPTDVTLTESGTLPSGLSFTDNGDGTAALAGTPDAGSAGSYPLTITASNGVVPGATQSFTLVVQEAPPPPGAPTAPQDVSATSGVDAGQVSWSPPLSQGQSSVSSYTITSSPGGKTATFGGSQTQGSVAGLTAGKEYTFTVSATNGAGTGPSSAASNAVLAVSNPLLSPTSATGLSPSGTAATGAITGGSSTTLSASATGLGTINIGSYASDPVPPLSNGTAFYDVQSTPGSSFSAVSFQICGGAASATVAWWNPSTQSWQPASDQSAPSGSPLCITVSILGGTSPSLVGLTGTVFGLVTPPGSSSGTNPITVPTVAPPSYRLIAADGGIFDFNAPFDGSLGGLRLNAPVVGVATERGTDGYLMAAQDGGVFSFGSASFYGSLGGQRLPSPISVIATTFSGDGYWLLSRAGTIYQFGNAPSFPKISLPSGASVVAAASTPTGKGLWVTDSRGDVYTEGDAPFLGSLGGQHLNAPIVGMAPSPQGIGYVLVSSDGGVFTFGTNFEGSAASIHLSQPVVGIAETASGNGYWLVASDGGVFSFGDAPFLGSMGGKRLNAPLVGIAALGSGSS